MGSPVPGVVPVVTLTAGAGGEEVGTTLTIPLTGAWRLPGHRTATTQCVHTRAGDRSMATTLTTA